MKENTIISVQNEHLNTTIPQIDEANYFNLKVGITKRPQMLDFAIALGHDKGPTPLAVGKDDFTRGSYITRSEFLYHALLHKQGRVGEIADEHIVGTYIEQYANSGFDKLAELIATTKDTQLAKRLLLEMDEEYDQIESLLNKII